MMIEGLHVMVGCGLVLVGVFFLFTGALGLVRMPDFFTRLHPAGVADTAGIPLVLLGLICISGFSIHSMKLFLLLLFLLLASPTACHALAKAAHLEERRKVDDPKAKKNKEPSA